MASFEVNLLTQWHEICSQLQETRSPRYHMAKPGVSISPRLGLVPGCDGLTEGQTNRQTELRYLILAYHYVLSRVKTDFLNLRCATY